MIALACAFDIIKIKILVDILSDIVLYIWAKIRWDSFQIFKGSQKGAKFSHERNNFDFLN